ncbi:MAG: hypothetical protein JO102_06135, partial [Elusimicrobia bacterium]|nr:hypothetical protein [Elusimicrobiota bacterium]
AGIHPDLGLKLRTAAYELYEFLEYAEERVPLLLVAASDLRSARARLAESTDPAHVDAARLEVQMAVRHLERVLANAPAGERADLSQTIEVLDLALRTMTNFNQPAMEPLTIGEPTVTPEEAAAAESLFTLAAVQSALADAIERINNDPVFAALSEIRARINERIEAMHHQLARAKFVVLQEFVLRQMEEQARATPGFRDAVVRPAPLPARPPLSWNRFGHAVLGMTVLAAGLVSAVVLLVHPDMSFVAKMPLILLVMSLPIRFGATVVVQATRDMNAARESSRRPPVTAALVPANGNGSTNGSGAANGDGSPTNSLLFLIARGRTWARADLWGAAGYAGEAVVLPLAAILFHAVLGPAGFVLFAAVVAGYARLHQAKGGLHWEAHFVGFLGYVAFAALLGVDLGAATGFVRTLLLLLSVGLHAARDVPELARARREENAAEELAHVYAKALKAIAAGASPEAGIENLLGPIETAQLRRLDAKGASLVGFGSVNMNYFKKALEKEMSTTVWPEGTHWRDILRTVWGVNIANSPARADVARDGDLMIFVGDESEAEAERLKRLRATTPSDRNIYILARDGSYYADRLAKTAGIEVLAGADGRPLVNENGDIDLNALESLLALRPALRSNRRLVALLGAGASLPRFADEKQERALEAQLKRLGIDWSTLDAWIEGLPAVAPVGVMNLIRAAVAAWRSA